MKRKAAPDLAVERDKLERAVWFVRRQFFLFDEPGDEETVLAVARKIAAVIPPYSFRGKYL